MRRRLLLAACLAAACSSSPEERTYVPPETQRPVDLTLSRIDPPLVLPGTLLVARGAGFVPEPIGTGRILLRGDYAGRHVDVVLPTRYVNDDEVVADWSGTPDAVLEGEGTFSGEAWIEIDEDDGKTHVSSPLQIVFDVRASLAPELHTVVQGPIFVNDAIELQGAGFLLGGEEGNTVALIDGCFRELPASPCAPLATAQLVASPITRFDRNRVAFPFAPHIAGIRPGFFEGSVRLRNRHGQAAGSVEHETSDLQASYELLLTSIFDLSTSSASLGQYVDVEGGGFVGTLPGTSDRGLSATLLQLQGTFLPDGEVDRRDVAVTLIPEFVSGQLVRYVLSEQDDLGKALDLRKSAGVFDGTIKPIVQYHETTVEGEATQASFSVKHVRQVVWVNFLAAYVGSLRHFGLRAVDQLIRDRVFDIAKRDYAGVNIEFRPEVPEDFALYAQVDIGGPDPNGYGLLGYDNTPGKDADNLRLYDKIGGVNAATQEDGYPGYGGVFVESFFGFSEHPGSLTKKLEGADPFFDATFDPFRPDVGGTPVTTSDLNNVPTLTGGDACPADAADRPMQVACAVFVLGSMIGSTMTHEVGHSLGLADPYGGEFHNPGDQVNRLMDSGQFRSFLERAEILGGGPAVFCEEDYLYLRQILPTADPDPVASRPTCW